MGRLQEICEKDRVDVTEAKHFGFQVFKNSKDDMKYKATVSGISEEEWINHYCDLLYKEQITDTTPVRTGEYNAVSLNEVKDAISKMKNRKFSGVDETY
jgi:hypothetical protein